MTALVWQQPADMPLGAAKLSKLAFDGVDFKGRVPLSATADPAGVAGAGLVLFCVKSADTETAARAMAPHLCRGRLDSAIATRHLHVWFQVGGVGDKTPVWKSRRRVLSLSPRVHS